MEKFVSLGLLAAILVVLVAGTFMGLATAHDTGDTQMHEDCEMNQGENCTMSDDRMMSMGSDCPMEHRSGMMGMHGDSTDSHGDCPMH